MKSSGRESAGGTVEGEEYMRDLLRAGPAPASPTGDAAEGVEAKSPEDIEGERRMGTVFRLFLFAFSLSFARLGMPVQPCWCARTSAPATPSSSTASTRTTCGLCHLLGLAAWLCLS